MVLHGRFPQRLAIASVVVLGALVAFGGLSACGAKTATNPDGTGPVITAVSPVTPQPSIAAQTVTISGQQFLTGVVLLVTPPSGSPLVVSGSDIQALQSNSFVASIVFDQPGIYTLVAENLSGDASAPFLVTVQGAGSTTPTTPTITSASPISVSAGAQSVVVTLGGTNFVSGLTVTITPPTGAATSGGDVSFISSTMIEFNVVFNRKGLYTFTVTDPSGDGSNAASITAS